MGAMVIELTTITWLGNSYVVEAEEVCISGTERYDDMLRYGRDQRLKEEVAARGCDALGCVDRRLPSAAQRVFSRHVNFSHPLKRTSTYHNPHQAGVNSDWAVASPIHLA
jgi:hypothetical protein